MSNTLTRRSAAALERCRSWLSCRFGGAEAALCQMAAVITALVAGAALAATYWPKPVGYAVLWIGALALLELGLWLAQKILRRLLGRSLGWMMALLLLGGAVAYTVKRGAGEGWTWRVIVFSCLTALALALLAVSWRSLLRRRVPAPAVISAALLSAGAVALLAVFFFTDGFDDHAIRRYLALSQDRDARLEALEPSLGLGGCTVETLDYGPDGDLEAGTVSLTRYMDRDTDDLTGAYVDAYWDYDLSRVPLQGRVWYPAEEKNCPVLFIAHGNHEITTNSYLGYAYLGEYLASHGYVVVSVDQNACNMLSGENDGRAVLLLEHIGLLLAYNGERGNPLYGRLDDGNIAIAGHSRGGEMVATAYLFNGYDNYPENGTVKFDYHYNIKSIIAIAPTVNQYRPADHSVALEDVNYLLLHGAADRDVTKFMGMSQYENITFSGRGDYLKTALYIAGANHGQFNALWGAYDQSGPFSPLLNVESLLSEEDQQHIARIFVKIFLDVTLLGDESCRTLLTDWNACAAQLPDTVYAQCYETSGFTLIADFEEDSDLTTAAMAGAALNAVGADWWTEELMDFAGSTSYDTHALRLRWRRRAHYDVSTPELDMTDKSLTFDICDRDSDRVEKGEYALVDAGVQLTDADGNTAEAQLSDFTTVYPVLPVRTDKLDFLFDTCTYKSAFSTVTIPIDGFVPEGEGFDPGRVTEIRLCFSDSGQVNIDNIGLEPVWKERGEHA